MSITIDIQPEVEARLRARASSAGKNPAHYAAEILQIVLSSDGTSAYESALSMVINQTPEDKAAMHQRARALIIPGRLLPEGKSLQDMIVGKWPGDETDEQIEAALNELS